MIFRLKFNRITLLSVLTVILFNNLMALNHNEPAQQKKLEYITNKGQWDSKILYRADVANGAVFLEKNCITFNFINPDDIRLSGAHNNNKKKNPEYIHYHAYKLYFENTLKSVNIKGDEAASDYCNYFLGKDSTKWASKVNKYKVVNYHNIYNNIDLKVYSSGSDLKYNFIVHPGGNPDDITLRYEGSDNISLKENTIVHKLLFAEISELAPYTYIEDNENKIIPCKYVLNNYTLKFELQKRYNKKKTLVIDPQLVFSTYTGSTSDNWGFTATFDNDDNVYAGGLAFGVGYPVSMGAYQEKFAGDSTWTYGCDISIIKYDPSGTRRLYATFLGGRSAEMPHSLIINQFNELLIFGTTGSENFPVTKEAYCKTFKGGIAFGYDNVIRFNSGTDIYVSKLSPDGSKLLASTYIGGTDNDGMNFREYYNNHMMHGNDSLYFNYADGARGEIITDNQNNVYIGTSTFSNDFPVTGDSYQKNPGGKQDGIVFKLDYNLSNLIWGSYLGGANDDAIYSVDVDKDYNILVAGGTSSLNFPVADNAYKNTYQGGTTDGFVAKISIDGKQLLGSTYYGSPQYDQAFFVRVDNENFVYITGQTKAKANSLVYKADYNIPNSGQFIAKLTPTLDTIKWSTVFGSGNGRPNISITAFAVDICSKIYLAGWGREWPMSDSINWQNIQGTKYMEVTPDAYQSVSDGQDFYIMVITDDASKLLYATFLGELYYTSCGYSGHDHVDGGTSRFDKRGNIYESACASCGMCQRFPTYPNPGAWSNTNNSNNCNNAVFKFNVFKGFALADFEILSKGVVPSTGCAPFKVNFNNKSEGTKFLWDFGDKSTSTEKNPEHTYQKGGTYYIKLISIDSLSCNITDTLIKQLHILSDTTYSLPDIETCSGYKKIIGIDPINDSTLTYRWIPTDSISDPYISNPFANPTITTEYLLLISNSICTDTIKQKFLIHDLTVDASKDTTICFGSSYKITATATAQETVTYQWSSSLAFKDYLNPGPTINYATVKPFKNTTYFIKVTTKYCQAIDSIRINISHAKIKVNNDTTICKGDTIKLYAKNMLQVPIVYYRWTPTNGIISGNNDSIALAAPQQSIVYKIDIRDKLDCIASDSIRITVSAIEATSTVTDIKCHNDCNGKIALVASGGRLPYNYLWNNSSTLSTVDNLCNGAYKVTVSDASGCKTIKDYNLVNPDTLTIEITNITNVQCNGEHNGTATVKTTGGVLPYIYFWNTVPPQTIATANGLGAGTYGVTVTDYNGCSKSTFVNISDTSTFKVTIDTIPPQCYNICDGYAKANASGGKPPYTYLWDNTKTAISVNDLCSGNHTLVVKDSQSCERTIPFNLSQAAKLNLSAKLIKAASCFEVCNGSACIIASGGSGKLKYLWSTSSTNDTIDAACRGNYTITITDNNNCSATENIFIPSPEPLKVVVDKTNVPCTSVCNAKAFANTTGGTKPYYYSWSNKEVMNYISSLCVGNYSLTVTDANNCITRSVFNIKDSLNLPDFTITAEYNTIKPSQPDKITILPARTEFNYSWTPTTFIDKPYSSSPVVYPQKTTVYYLRITDKYGCTRIDSIKINVDDVICREPYIYIPNTFTPELSTNNVLYVRSSVIASFTIRIYNRWGEEVKQFNDLKDSWDGTYKGKKCEAGVFDYYIEATCINQETYKGKGNITLLR